MPIDRLNKDVTPDAVEGYEWKFGSCGWRKTKTKTIEEKQAKAKLLTDARIAKKEAQKPEQEDLKSLLKEVKALTARLNSSAIEKPKKVEEPKKVEIAENKVISVPQEPKQRTTHVVKKIVHRPLKTSNPLLKDFLELVEIEEEVTDE